MPLGQDGLRGRGEAGAYLILYALLAVALFTMAALVLDIAALRQGRRADRATSDLAATAGVASLDPFDDSSFAAACETAWGYVLANRSEAEGTVSAPDCSTAFPSAVPCTPLLAERRATASIGPITVEITHPVLDGSSLMLAEVESGDRPQAIAPATDGTACERLGVRIRRTRTFLFGQVAGINGANTDVHTVARARTTPSVTEVPAIVSLERIGCNGVATGVDGGHLDVQGVGQSGTIVVDSDGSACAAGFTIDPASPRVRASGAPSGLISSFALAGANFARAFDPADVSAAPPQLSPQPTPALTRTGRAFIDTRYNCNGVACTGAPEIDNLEAALGAGPPALYTPYVGPCTTTNVDPPIVLVGDTFIDCPVFDIGNSVTINGGSVVFAGDVFVRPNGCLAINDAVCGAIGLAVSDEVAFVRGRLTKEQGSSIALPRVFVYAVAGVDMQLDPNPAGTSLLVWTAPLAGPFEDLLLWTETTNPVGIAQQLNGTNLEGTAFAPNTTVTLESRNGQTMTLPLQLVANRVFLQGRGDVVLRPGLGRGTGRLTAQVRLVR